MIIKRDSYLNELIRKRNNGLIKIITGIRRCGKSFLLFKLFRSYLLSHGISEQNIITLSLEDDASARYRNPLELGEYIRGRIVDENAEYIIMLDEIQNVKEVKNPWLEGDTIGFVDVLLGLMKINNADIYITGSNSKMLSSDIVTSFRDRGDEVRLYPLTYREYHSAYSGSERECWREYYTYGGLPRVLYLPTHGEKMSYLQNLFENTYKRDVLERHQIRNDKNALDDLLNIVASSVGSLTNPTKLSNTFKSVKGVSINPTTVSNYLGYLIEAFILDNAYRYDIKGKKYINTPLKYYFTDVGLRNAHLNFRQLEENHIMENIIFTELKVRGYSVDVGMLEHRQSNGTRKYLEVDFIASAGYKKYYIQSALSIDEPEKHQQEIQPLVNIADSFKKVVVVREHIMPFTDEKGIAYIGIEDFLLDANSLEI